MTSWMTSGIGNEIFEHESLEIRDSAERLKHRDRSAMALPAHSQELCFSTDVFLDENFNVDEFVSQCRKRVTIECLREDLESYFRTLKSAMVELINKDYADFVNLSSNLVGMEKAIGNIVHIILLPGGYGKGNREYCSSSGAIKGGGCGKDQLASNPGFQKSSAGKTGNEAKDQQALSYDKLSPSQDIKSSMEAIINATERKLAQRAEIREKKVTLQRLVSILESVEKLERLLKISSRPPSSGAVASEIEQLAEREEFASVVMERIASEFNKLQYSVSHTTGHPLVEEVKPRITTITATLQASLEQSLRAGLVGGDKETLTRCLQTYTAINREQAAESMFQNLIVHPYMDKVISVKAVLTHPQGLSGMYSEVLRFIPKHCSLLLEITQHKADQGVSGFDFVVNAVWPEVVTLIDTKASVVFAPGNPDSFHKNYMATMEFVASFESLCPSQLSVKRLRVHPSFTSFMSKWSLPVYFQIRFQDIAGALEGSLLLPLVEAKAESGFPPFKLELFQVLWRCLHQCWSNGVFVPALVHRFWKLTLQLLVRTMTWLEELSGPQDTQLGEKRDTLTVATCLQVIHDCEELASQIHKVYSELIHPKIPLQALKNPRCLEDGLEEATDRMQQVAPKYAARIIAEVSQQCIHNLEPAHTIPRLYRRTNREAPQKHSSYVSNILKPLQTLSGDLPPGNQNDWNHQIVQSVTSRYFDITSDVLTSVKRTEDSLLKLKRNRKSLVPSSSASGMSDDNKIRLQLALDIKEYSAQVHALRLDFRELPSLAKLQEMGEAAKTTALSSPS